jgi:hypothetical protein
MRLKSCAERPRAIAETSVSGYRNGGDVRALGTNDLQQL